MFTPTLDWGNELWASLMWIAKGWAIAAIATLVILRPDRPVHRLGQAVLAHHRRTISPVAESVKVWLWLAVILFLVMVGVRLEVLLSFQSNDMLTSFQIVEAGREAAAAGDDAVKSLGKERLLPVPRSFSRSWPPCSSHGSCWTCSWCSGSAWRGAHG